MNGASDATRRALASAVNSESAWRSARLLMMSTFPGVQAAIAAAASGEAKRDRAAAIDEWHEGGGVVDEGK